MDNNTILSISQNDVAVDLPDIGTRAYQNSARGRADLTADAPPERIAEIFAVWGDAPTVVNEADQAEAILQTTANEA